MDTISEHNYYLKYVADKTKCFQDYKKIYSNKTITQKSDSKIILPVILGWVGNQNLRTREKKAILGGGQALVGILNDN